MEERQKLNIVVLDRSRVLKEHQCTATSDLNVSMFDGSLREVNEADMVVVRDKDQLIVLKYRISFDEMIERLRG